MWKDRVKEIIDSAMNQLKSEEYEVIYGLFFRNRSVRSLAMELGVSRPTIRYRKDRSLKHLKEIILNEVSREEIEELLEKLRG